MLGDAAGFVDPVTGEGLHYALRSADLLARAIVDNRPETYASAVRSDFLPELITASSYANRFYHGSFLRWRAPGPYDSNGCLQRGNAHHPA